MLTNFNIQLLNVTKNIHNHTQQLWPIKWDAKPHHYWVLCDFRNVYFPKLGKGTKFNWFVELAKI